jgi:chromosome segregation ATPase
MTESNPSTVTATKLAALGERLRNIDAQIAELEVRRSDHALDYAQGNRTAQRAVADLDARIDQLKRERSMLASAIEQTEQLLRDEQTRLLEKHEREKQRKAHDLAHSIAVSNQEIDAELGKLRDQLVQRAEQLQQLANLHVVEPGLIGRLSDSRTVAAAFQAAGLHRLAI